jgi:hypothetical protein
MAGERLTPPDETAPVGRVHFLLHKLQPLLLIDFTHCAPQQVLQVVEQVQAEIAKHPPDSLLTLADYTGAQVDKAAATRIQEALVFDRPHIKRSAWVGTENLPKAFYEKFKNFSQRDFPKFASREEAMEWLVKE